MAAQQDEIRVQGRRFGVVVVDSKPRWIAVVYGEDVLVRDTGDAGLNAIVARVAVRALLLNHSTL